MAGDTYSAAECAAKHGELVRELRAVRDTQARQGEALARIESSLTGDVAGEHPGLLHRVADLERVEAGRRRAWWAVVCSAIAAAVAAAAAWFRT